ncbi:hypothetical protein ACFFRR_007485 [Megaselia abdita]
MLNVKFAVLLIGIVGISAFPVEDEDPPQNLRRYVFPADLGSPICVVNGDPCTEEDYEEGRQYLREYVDTRVKEFVDVDIQEPQCLASDNCESDVLESYTKERERKEAEIRKLFKVVNRL